MEKKVKISYTIWKGGSMYKLIRQKRKSIKIEVDEHAEVIVKVPLFVPKDEIETLLFEKRAWLEKTIETKKRVKERTDWIKNEEILYLGEYRKIVFIKENHLKNKIVYKEGIFYIYTADDNKENLHKMMYVWMKEKAYLLFKERTHYYAEKIGCTYGKITIRNQKTRWGSCSNKKNISYNVRMMCAPIDKIDYIILHEVMHLKYFNHGPLFWKEIEKIMPDYREKEAYFKKNGIFFHI